MDWLWPNLLLRGDLFSTGQLALLRQYRQHRLRLKRLFRSGPRMVWTRAISIVADAADGADDVMEWVLTRGRDPDRAHSQSALAAEHNFNPECAEEAQRPAQPASECTWTLWPVRPVGADLQKIGCASPPLRFVGDDLAYERRHRIGVDDVLNRGAPVVSNKRLRVCPRVEMRSRRL